MCETYIDLLPLTRLQPGTWPATQACTLTGNHTGDFGDFLVCRLALNPLSHTSQGWVIFPCDICRGHLGIQLRAHLGLERSRWQSVRVAG